MQKVSPIPFTKEGYDSLIKEKEALLVKRLSVVDELRRAREMGDLSENGAYKGARMSLSSLDNRLRYVTHVLRYAYTIQAGETDVIVIGSTVIVKNKKEETMYRIVGKHESDPSRGKISVNSPLGKELIGKKVGEKVFFHAPNGMYTYIVVSIQ